MKIAKAIRELHPGISKVDVGKAIAILEGEPLIQSAELRPADYSLPIHPWDYEPLDVFTDYLHERCSNGPIPFCAIASTQVIASGAYPVSVYEMGCVVLNHPTYTITSEEYILTLDGCGSLPGIYIARYPAEVHVQYTKWDGKYIAENVVLEPWLADQRCWVTYVHEADHLQGFTALTSPDIQILSLENLSREDWEYVAEHLLENLEDDYHEEVDETLAAIPHPKFPSSISREKLGKITLATYLQTWCEDLETPEPPLVVLPSGDTITLQMLAEQCMHI